MDRNTFHDEIVNSGCTPACDCVKEPPKEPLSKLLGKLNDLSNENLSLVCSIGDNLYGSGPKTDGNAEGSIDCMESCIRNILEYAYETNRRLIKIRERL